MAIDIPFTTPLDLGPWGVDAELRVVGGHTPGSLVVDLHDGRMISGDLVRSSLVRHHVPALHFFHDDLDGAHRALADLLDAGATMLLPAHGGELAADDVAAWLERGAPRGDDAVVARH